MVNRDKKLRLDEWLAANGFYDSRARARDAVLRGCVRIDGVVCTKPSKGMAGTEDVKVDDPAANYVSRAALKLVHGLEHTGFDPARKVALDIGASTGGFCQVLLEREARQVFAVDVGHGQMAASVLADPRIVNLEGLSARELTIEHLNNTRPQFLTCDVSFVSLKLALPAALELAQKNAKGIFLVKPQFEVGRDNINKSGLVRNRELAHSAAREVHDWLSTVTGWQATHFTPSPISGGDGNCEYLIAGFKHG